MTFVHPEGLSAHSTPRMHQRPTDPAYDMLDKVPVTEQKVYRSTCYICTDREFARLGMPLCNPCCNCRTKGADGHIAADDGECDDCGHALCQGCYKEPKQEAPICTCDTPCCEADVGVGVITCGSQHCPEHGRSHDS